MSDNALLIPKEKIPEFSKDIKLICDNSQKFLQEVFPYTIPNDIADDIADDQVEGNFTDLLETVKFFRVENCTIEKNENVFEYLNGNIQKYLAAAYSIGIPLIYGIVGHEGKTSLVLGIEPLAEEEENQKTIKRMLQGLLPDIKLSDCKYVPGDRKAFGIIAGTPSYIINEEPQSFDYSALMRSLNGQDYTLMVLAKPVNSGKIQQKISSLTAMKDECLAVSKRDVSLHENSAHMEGGSTAKTNIHNVNVSVFGAFAPGGMGGGVSGGYGRSWSNAIIKNISDTITKGTSLRLELQNGFALDLVKRIDSAIERLQKGLNIGLWQSIICYSAENTLGLKLMQGCLYGELLKPDSLSLPPRIFDISQIQNKNRETLLIPKNMIGKNGDASINLYSYANTQELSLLFSLPDKNVPGYELRTGKRYPVSFTCSESESKGGSVELGAICDASTKFDNIPFFISNKDLNKHTFVCGITGSGKTNTVKHIISNMDKPFWVIECAKKEYRSLKIENDRTLKIYTPGVPEINCLSLNPFYIMPGISPQMHIDYLKDLFNASFSFFGPMPYIIEKCLHNVYAKRGWNLSLGFHPYLANTKSVLNRYDFEYMKKRYKTKEHYYLFPTMMDLLNEVKNYVEKMGYKGEVLENIKTAIIARLDSICVGAKGYMLNTNDFPDFSGLTKINVLFELEGLADDTDKAFAVGLLIIYLREHRIIEKEQSHSCNTDLKHLLVVEEAHRLLKNVSTERTSEGMGNPKGKAIEHFTNMIAEMRSFGQGVLISEQIPTKIAPDVIKNSSNKIIHRIVARDDQLVIANMIGMDESDAVYLGDQITGRALTHVEGMRLPVSVAVTEVTEKIPRSDDDLRQKDLERNELLVLKSTIFPYLVNRRCGIESNIIKLINTIFDGDLEKTKNAIKTIVIDSEFAIKRQNAYLLSMYKVDDAIHAVLAELLVKSLLSGVYQRKDLPENSFATIKTVFEAPYEQQIEKLMTLFTTEIDNHESLMENAVTELSLRRIRKNEKQGKTWDYHELISSYFYTARNETVDKIEQKIRDRIQAGVISC